MEFIRKAWKKRLTNIWAWFHCYTCTAIVTVKYCKFSNFRENFIFANKVKIHKTATLKLCDWSMIYHIRPRGYSIFYAHLVWARHLSCSSMLKWQPCQMVGILIFISMINTTAEGLKARNFFICRYFSFYEQLKFSTQLSRAWTKFYNLGASKRQSDSPYANSSELTVSYSNQGVLLLNMFTVQSWKKSVL